MKIGITGASGFVGKYVLEYALKAGYDARALVRKPGDLRQFGTLSKVLETVIGDMSDSRSLKEFAAGCDAIIHLAAATKGVWEDYEKGTVNGTKELLRIAREAGVKRFILLSSVSVYDLSTLKRPHMVDEDTPLETQLDARGYYGKAKALADLEAQDYLYDKQMAVTIFRAGLIYGRDMKFPLMGTGIQKGGVIINPGFGQKRVPYIHISDVLSALDRAFTASDPRGIFNLVSNEQPEVRTIIEAYNKFQEKKIRVLYLPKSLFVFLPLLMKMFPLFTKIGRFAFLLHRTQMDVFYDSTKAQKILEWTPTTPFTAAMREITQTITRQIRVVVCGLGFAFQTLHLPVLFSNPRILVVGLFDADEARVKKVQKEHFPEARIFLSVDEICDAAVADAAVVITPPKTHHQIAKALIQAGYHVLLEKPATESIGEAEELLALAREYRKRVGVVHNYRYRANVLALERALAIDKDRLSDIRVKFYSGPVYEGKDRWRAQLPNVLTHEMAYHFIDLARHLTGMPIRFSLIDQRIDKIDGRVRDLFAAGHAGEETHVSFDLKLHRAYSETCIDFSTEKKCYRLRFYPESFEVLQGSVTPIGEVKRIIRTVISYALKKIRKDAPSHARIYQIFSECVQSNLMPLPFDIGDAIRTMKIVDELNQGTGMRDKERGKRN